MFSDPAYLSKTITVNNPAALNDALDNEYGAVVAVGDAALSLRESIKKYADNRKLSKLSNMVFLLTPFNPLLFISLGIIGKYLTSDKVSKYRVNIGGSDCVLLIHKQATLTESQKKDIEAYTH